MADPATLTMLAIGLGAGGLASTLMNKPGAPAAPEKLQPTQQPTQQPQGGKPGAQSGQPMSFLAGARAAGPEAAGPQGLGKSLLGA